MTIGEVIVSKGDIAQVIQEIVSEVIEDYGDADLLLVGVMDGAICFLADLIRAFPRSVEIATARVSSYEGAKPGELLLGYLPTERQVSGRHVLIVEDIVDTGATAAMLRDALVELGAASVELCALLNKPSRRTHGVEVAYTGFDVPDVFVVGYGLDYNGAYRNLPEIVELDPEA